MKSIILLLAFTEMALSKDIMYDNKMNELFSNFSKKNLNCHLASKLNGTEFSIRTPEYSGPPVYVFHPPIESDIEIYKDHGGEHSDCKVNGDIINCINSEPGEGPEHNTQTFQYLDLKLDKEFSKGGEIIDMHLYKIQKSYFGSWVYKERKHSEIFCPEQKDLTTPDRSISSTSAKK